MAVIIIPCGGESLEITDFKDEPPLAWLQEQVAGPIVMIALGNDQLIVNEEGWLKQLKLNPAATKLLTMQTQKFAQIVGQAVLLSGDNKLK